MSSDAVEKPWLDGIGGEQLPKLITSDASIIRVIAGPGSGKTTGLKRRVQRLVMRDGVDPNSIFVGTFTRAITEELTERLNSPSPYVSTLHSFALSLLKDNPHVLGEHYLRFLLNFEIDNMLYDVGTNLEENYTLPELRDELKELQAKRAKREELEGARFAGEVDRWLYRHKGMLIEEVVPRATQALEAEDIPQGRFDHVVIDEYQDLTECEQQLVELIWSGEGSLLVLGDDDQSIYGFRYNHPEGVEGFEQNHKKVVDINIESNWRSGAKIVDIANLMMQEAGPSKPPMETKREREGTATLLYWPSLEAEVEGLSKLVSRKPEKTFLVLVPRKLVGYKLSESIGGDARTEFTQQSLDHPLTQRRFTLGTLLANDYEDLVSFRAWLGFHYDGSRATSSKRNSEAYKDIFQPNSSVKQILEEFEKGNIRVEGRGRKNIRRRLDLLLDFYEQAPENLPEVLDFLFDPGLAKQIEDQEKSNWVAEDLERLRKCAHSIIEEERDIGLKALLDRVRYRIVTRAPLVELEENSRVRIMTLHSAKGLEEDVVLIAGAADQMVPGISDREEQRRLLYVAITRAKNNLIVSWPKKVPLKVARSNNIRVDEVFCENEKRWAGLSCTKLLPAGAPKPQAGIRLVRS